MDWGGGTFKAAFENLKVNGPQLPEVPSQPGVEIHHSGSPPILKSPQLRNIVLKAPCLFLNFPFHFHVSGGA